MLRNLRNTGKTFLGKIVAGVLFTLLILSFAVWGINDIFTGGASTTVARVGETEISAESARNTYQEQLRRLSIQFGQPLTPQQATALGLERQVLSTLVNEATLNERARALGLSVSDQLVARSIVDDPTFRGTDGSFNRGLFTNLLQSNGLTEQRYVAEERNAIARRQIVEALGEDFTAPVIAQEALHRFGAERRAARYVLLDAASAGEIAQPSEEELARFHQENAIRYRAPEFRAVTVLSVSPASVADPSAVSDAAARARYGQVAETRFGSPERREVQRIQFPNEDEARAAAARLASGEIDFEGLAQERAVPRDVLELGLLERGQFVDPAIAAAAFALAEGEVSEPVAGRFGPSLVRVVAIAPAAVRPFEEVADEIRAELALQEAADRVRRLYDEIEDQRASARPLADIARERGLDARAFPAVDAQGRGPGGAAIDLPLPGQLPRAIFESDIGIDNAAIRTDDGGYVWFDVTGVQPARNLALDEAREAVLADWRAERIEDRLAETARGLVERLRAGESLDALAAETGATVAAAENLGRGQGQGDLDAGAVRAVFATRVGEPGTARLGADRRLVFVVDSATAPPFLTTTPQAEQISQRMAAEMGGDVLAQYVTQLQREIGLTINESLFRQAIGLEF